MLARAENDLDFFSRRALEEARAAAAASSVTVGSAHRQMAAIYAQRLRDQHLEDEGVGDFLSDLSHRDLDYPQALDDWFADGAYDGGAFHGVAFDDDEADTLLVDDGRSAVETSGFDLEADRNDRRSARRRGK